jgi:hypothetical protein
MRGDGFGIPNKRVSMLQSRNEATFYGPVLELIEQREFYECVHLNDVEDFRNINSCSRLRRLLLTPITHAQ